MLDEEEYPDWTGTNPVAKVFNPDKLLEDQIVKDLRGREKRPMSKRQYKYFESKGNKF